MKNKFLKLIILISLSALLLNGCGNTSTSTDNNVFSSESYEQSVDIDLTILSSTVRYSEVFNITNNPFDYLGKVIKMSGNSAVFYDETDGQNYYSCLIPDAAACCSQGIEYSLSDGNYPEEGTEITVVGTFSTYTIGDSTYFTLKDAVLE